MASPSIAKTGLPTFMIFPTDHSVYPWRVAATSNPNLALSRHRNLEFAIMDASYRNAEAEGWTEEFSQCSWCSPESSYGACDGGYPCQSIATVHDLEDDQAYCHHHFFTRDGVR